MGWYDSSINADSPETARCVSTASRELQFIAARLQLATVTRLPTAPKLLLARNSALWTAPSAVVTALLPMGSGNDRSVEIPRPCFDSTTTDWRRHGQSLGLRGKSSMSRSRM